jgi:hypothetical protein
VRRIAVQGESFLRISVLIWLFKGLILKNYSQEAGAKL